MDLLGQSLAGLSKLWRTAPAFARRRLLSALNHSFMVGVVGFLLDPEDRLLLLDHRFRTTSRWGLPGGFIRRDERLEAALSRELHEEVGLSAVLDPNPLSVELSHKGGYLTICMGGRLPADITVTPRSVEIRGGGMFSIDRLPPMPEDHALGLRGYFKQLQLGPEARVFDSSDGASTYALRARSIQEDPKR